MSANFGKPFFGLHMPNYTYPGVPDDQLFEKVVEFAQAAETAGFDKMTSILKIHLKNGKIVTGEAAFGKGSPSNPMSFDEAAVKFRGCAEYAGWTPEKMEKIITFVRGLNAVPDVNVLSPLLSA